MIVNPFDCNNLSIQIEIKLCAHKIRLICMTKKEFDSLKQILFCVMSSELY